MGVFQSGNEINTISWQWLDQLQYNTTDIDFNKTGVIMLPDF